MGGGGGGRQGNLCAFCLANFPLSLSCPSVPPSSLSLASSLLPPFSLTSLLLLPHLSPCLLSVLLLSTYVPYSPSPFHLPLTYLPPPCHSFLRTPSLSPCHPSSPPPLPPCHPLPLSLPLTPSLPPLSPPPSLPPPHPLSPCHPLLTPSLPLCHPLTPCHSLPPPSLPVTPSSPPPSLFVTLSLSLTPSLPPSVQVLSKGSRQALVAMLNTTKGVDPKEEKRSKVKVEADAVINFRQLAVGADEQAEVRGSLQSW